MSYPSPLEPEDKLPEDVETEPFERDEYDDRLQMPDVTPEKENDEG